MGLEDRKGIVCYYRKERRGQRVSSVYVDSGAMALLIAQGDKQLRLERERERERLRREHESFMREEAMLDGIENQLRALTVSTLTALGFHLHNREWRLRRA